MNEKENTLYVKARNELVTIKNTSTDPDAAELSIQAIKAMDSYYRCTKAASKNKRVKEVRSCYLFLLPKYYEASAELARWFTYVQSEKNDARTLAKRANLLMTLGVPAGCMKSLREMQQALEAFDRNSLPCRDAVQRALAHYIRERSVELEFSSVLDIEYLLADVDTWLRFQQSRLDIVLF